MDPANHGSPVPQEIASVAKGAGITFVGKIFGGGVQYFYLIFIARWLKSESFGLFVLGFTLIEFAGIVSRLGMEGAVVRFVSLYQGLKDDRRTKGVILRTLQYAGASGLLWCLILWLIPSSVFDITFKKIGLAPIVKVLALSLPFTAVMVVAVNATQGFQTMTYTVYSQNLLQPLSNLLLAAIFIMLGWEVAGVAVAYVLSVLATAFLAVFFVSRLFPPLFRVKAVTESRQIFGFSLPFLSITFLILLILWTDIIMLGFFRSASEVGIYNAAAKTALLLNTILLNFSHIFSPIISALYEKGELTKLSYLYKTITKWCFSLSLPVFIILACLAPEIMSLFGHGFAIGWQPLAILAFAQFINVSTGPVVHILIMSGKQNLMVVNGLIICVINILLNFFLIPIYGIVGAALASSAAVVLFNASMLLEIKVMMNMFPYSKKFLKPVLIGLLSLLGLVLSKQVLAHLESPTKLLLFPLILFSIYVPCMLFWGLEEEDRLILNLIKQKLPLTKVI